MPEAVADHGKLKQWQAQTVDEQQYGESI